MARRIEIAFTCTACGREAVAGPDGRGGCPCGAQRVLDVSDSLDAGGVLTKCPVCAGAQFYVQRDFNQKAGLAIVIVGAALAPFTPYYASLFVAAIVDAVLYALLPEITVCYRCQAHFRGFERNPKHQPFDLHIAEQYDAGVRPS
jgi:hypothetical protein